VEVMQMREDHSSRQRLPSADHLQMIVVAHG
jgi:hypothetical protein